MQKKSNFVIITKFRIIILAFILLTVSIFMAKRIKSPSKATNEPSYKPSSSIYIQLRNYSEYNDASVQQTEKMNNSIFENANIEFQSIITPTTDVSFDGSIRLLDAETGKVTASDLEYYTLCALIAEMPQSFDSEALMAQAVACRTFAVRNASVSPKHKNADVCTDYRCCQSFTDANSADFDIRKAVEAVNATKGIIAVCDGQPILAAYHAASAGKTKSSKEVWGGELSYLVPVISAESKEASAKKVSFSKSSMESVLNSNNYSGSITFSSDAEGICTTAYCGGVAITPQNLRRMLSLRSDTFSVYFDGTSYHFTCYGYGHGVGLSQYGADALAKDGYSFYEILKHYYTGISFEFLE